MKNKNATVWVAQSTMDYIYQFDDINDLIKVFDAFIKKEILQEYYPQFEKIRKNGLIDFEDKKVKNGAELLKAVDCLKEKSLEGMILSGGSPFLAAEIEWYLYAADEQLPRPYFCGNLPVPTQVYIKEKGLEQLCEHALRVNKHPGTLSLELPPSKVMLACPEARTLKEFNQNDFKDNLKKIVTECKEVVLALGGLNSDPAEEYISFIKSIKEEFPRVKIFIGTNSFAKKSSEEIKKYWELLQLGDVVSFNDEELKTVYDTIYGPRQISLARKLKELEHPGIKICHAAEGVILDSGPGPDKIIRNLYFLEDSSLFLQDALQYAVDGATYIYEHSGKKGYPSQRGISLYSKNIRTKQKDGFGVKFVYPDSTLTNGLSYVISPKVDFALGRLTGAGSFFDGILVTYLFR